MVVSVVSISNWPIIYSWWRHHQYLTDSIKQVPSININSEQRNLDHHLKRDTFLIVETQLRMTASRKSAYRATLSHYCRQSFKIQLKKNVLETDHNEQVMFEPKPSSALTESAII